MWGNGGDGLLAVVVVEMMLVLPTMMEVTVVLAILCSYSGDLGCDGGDKNCELQQGQDDYF